MAWLEGVEWILVGVAAVIVVACVALFVRRRLLSSHGSVFDCSMRSWKSGAPSGWAMGMARYQGDMFQWYRAFSFLPAPSAQLPRETLRVAGQRRADDLEAMALFGDHVIVDVAPADGQPRRELAMSPESLTGLLSWLEAAPPGGVTYRSLG